MKRNHRSFFSWSLPGILVTLILAAFLSGVTQIRTDHSTEDKQQLEQALLRATVACYAAEGIYPPSVEYLEQHYGIQINKNRYTVKYEVIASNLFPDITVLEVKP